MKKVDFFAVILIGISILYGGCKQQSSSSIDNIEIGTGDITGIYYLTGGAISLMVNKKSSKYKISVDVVKTRGSVENINDVMDEKLEKRKFGIAQSDRQWQAYNGKAEWEEHGEQRGLRSVFSIQNESITLIASEGSNIKVIKDLKGKRVNLGIEGSGPLQNSRDVLWAADLTEADISAKKYTYSEVLIKFQKGEIDALFYTVGHPNLNIREATSGAIKAFIVPIRGQKIDWLTEESHKYKKMMINRLHYPNALNEKDIDTIGVKAILVTSKEVPEDIVYAVTKEVFENFEEFKSLHEAFKELTKVTMLKGISVPIHRGALKYYKEVKLDKHIDPKLIID